MRTRTAGLPFLFSALAVILLVGASANPAAAQTPASRCGDKDAEQALNLPDHYKSWGQAHQIFTRFGQCDDGAVGEGFSEAIAQLFIHDWQHVGTLVRLTGSDAGFKKFVLWHIDATLSEDELQAIVRNARTRCPAEDKSFCRAVENNALASLKELRSDSE